jgi:signal transduction histidine kinase
LRLLDLQASYQYCFAQPQRGTKGVLLMKSSRSYVLLTGIVIGTLSVGIAIRSLLHDEIWINQPLHSSLEALGGLAAIVLAFVLLARKPEQRDPKAQTVAVGFLGMGLLECFHAAAPSGDAFVLLRNAASLVGSLGFALCAISGIPPRLARSNLAPRAIIVGATLFGLWSLNFPHHMPYMTRHDEFSVRAIGVSAFACACFIAGAIAFIAEYRRSSRPESYLFACLALLFASAELMFLPSKPWDGGWWFWHITRFTAYILVLGYVSRGYALMVTDLRRTLAETQRSERRLAAQYEVTRVLAESSTLNDAGPSILQAIGESLDWELGIFWSVDEKGCVLRSVDLWHVPHLQAAEFVIDSRQRTFARGIGLPGRVWTSGAPDWILDVMKDANFPRAPFAAKVGLHGAFAFPIRIGDQVYGVLEFFSHEIRDPDRDLLNMVGDIGTKIGQFFERKETAATLRLTEAKLIEEAKLAEVARLVADIGHDLKNLLTPIVMGASHMQGELEECESMLPHIDSDQTRATLVQSKDILVMIRTAARRIQDRVREIADSVKGLSSPPEFSRCHVEQIVAEVFETLRIVADQQGVSLLAEQLGTLPPIMADDGRLFNAFYNLVNNAIPEVPREGSITVRGCTDQQAKTIIVSVADTGRGMAPEVRESLFTYRAASQKHGGTGLGTKIVKDVIDAHGGRITVESEPGAGTTFQMVLPIDGPSFSVTHSA